MKVKFWGTRGSLPTALTSASVRAKLREALLRAKGIDLTSEKAVEAYLDGLPFSIAGTYGGNSPCVQLVDGQEELFFFDLGSGARDLGQSLIQKYGSPKLPVPVNIVMSHLHWDHIMGFPFFTPAYVPGNVIRIHGCHAELREAFERQHGAPSFPVDFKALGARIEFVVLDPDETHHVGGFDLRIMKQRHTGDSYGYRATRNGRSVVYATDSEHRIDTAEEAYPYTEFFWGADVVVFDTMYSLADAVSIREDWGHSSNMVAVELAQFAHVKHLVLFHHEPTCDDAMLDLILGETQAFAQLSPSEPPLQISSAYDGLEIEA
ncbi:MBL fold metallo-hydrolase [Zavarzinia sp. CC-PAN008]|uniref:MBL fold metallo-hydrolase n=1 Tax=Zavarzinia sp. CC-PAN008 TaxID=3243332 RepID=UPI003F747864